MRFWHRMKKFLLLVLGAALGTLAVSAYRDQPDGIFARFKQWAQPWVKDVQRKVGDRLSGAAGDVTAMVAGLLDPARFSFVCNYASGAAELARTVATSAPDSKGLGAVGEIMAEAALKPNFKVMAGEVANASAFVHDGERVIVYNKAWVADLSRSVASKWVLDAVLAHEIAHHLNGDTLPRAGSYDARDANKNHEQELAADFFAGFLLAKLGASEDEATQAVRKYAGEESHSHPSKARRITAHEQGWQKGHVPTAAPAPRAPELSAELVRLQQEIGRHAEHYGPGHVVVDGERVPCLVQYKLLFVGRTMKVKGIRYDARTRDITILEWQLDPKDGRPHPVSVQPTGQLDDAECSNVVVQNAGEFCYPVTAAERRDRDPEAFRKLLQRYVELAAR